MRSQANAHFNSELLTPNSSLLTPNSNLKCSQPSSAEAQQDFLLP